MYYLKYETSIMHIVIIRLMKFPNFKIEQQSTESIRGVWVTYHI
jgi:uncharacterized lipoprotein YddW (UPF0748 family)